MDVVIDCNGVGYAVSVPLSTADVVPAVGQNVTLFTIMVVREDAMSLFGFATTAERDAFRLLTSIQGIGGRIALGMLSATSIAELQAAIIGSNVIALQRLPGIGKKTAERLVIELRDKFLHIVPGAQMLATGGTAQHVEDAISALQALGFTRAAAEKSVKAALASHPEAQDSADRLIRLALQFTS
jgi:Holliday junction DNA helicase RuvA